MAEGGQFVGSAVDLRVKIPDDLVPLGVMDVDAVRLVKGQAHGEVLGLENIVRLEEVAVRGLRLVALAPDNMKTHSIPPCNRGVLFSIRPGVSKSNGGFCQNFRKNFVTFSLPNLAIFSSPAPQGIV